MQAFNNNYCYKYFIVKMLQYVFEDFFLICYINGEGLCEGICSIIDIFIYFCFFLKYYMIIEKKSKKTGLQVDKTQELFYNKKVK